MNRLEAICDEQLVQVKVCITCHEEKSLEEYHKRVRGDKTWRVNRCRACSYMANQEWRQANKRKLRAYYRKYARAYRKLPRVKAACAVSTRRHILKKKYGITEGDYGALLASQGGVCAICRSDNSRSSYKKFHVDHSHATGKVRGLLCSQCNVGLGSFCDKPELLIEAADYLRINDPNRKIDHEALK